jgi:P-type Cu+ transporter
VAPEGARHACRTDALTLPVEGMTCASCVGRVERALTAVPGVTGARRTSRRGACGSPARPRPRALAEALAQAGYPLAEARTELAIEGMHCASCTGRVERVLAQVPGCWRLRST